MRDHFQNLQALRGVACLMVVLFHLWGTERELVERTTLFLREIRWFGLAGVDLFFVLSGFLITATNRRNLGRPSAVPGYLFRRLWRIYPAYWVAMGLTFAFLWTMTGGNVVTPGLARSWQWWMLLVPVHDQNFVVALSWSLSYEVMFYLVFGALLFAPPRVAAVALAGWAGAVLFWLTRPVPSSPLGTLPVSPFVLEFLGGALVAWLIGRGARAWWRAAVVVGVVYAAAGIAVLNATAAQPYAEAIGTVKLRVLVFGPAAVLIVYGMVAAEGRWPRRVPRWLLRTGDASYSLYLIHPLVLFAGTFVGVHIPHNRVPHFLWLVGMFAAILVAGFALYTFVERPLLNLGRKKKRDARPQPAPAPAPPLAA